MATLAFKVQADYDKVIKLREEIARLETTMKGFGRNTPTETIKEMENRLATAKTAFSGLVTEAANAGATIDNNFKSKIYNASQAVNDLTEKIIAQKSVVKNVEFDVKNLAAAYNKALTAKITDPNKTSALKQELDAARNALVEEKAAFFGLTQEQATARLSVKRLKDEYAAFKDEAKDTTEANNGFTLSFGKIAGLIGGATALKELASQVVRVRGEFQNMETAIETLVGKDMSAKLMPQIKELAKVSPLTMTDIVGAEKMMLGFNIEAEKTTDFLKALSDVSMGNSQKFNSLTLAFSQMSAAGRLMGNDLNQMINAGFNPLQIISEKTGKSIATLKEEMAKGAVSAEMVQQAFLDATSAGGKFYNMSENTSKTIDGQMSIMQDAIDSVFNEVGTKTEGVIVKGIQTATSLVQNYEKIGKVLVGLVATYGTYRTAIFLSTAATSKHTLAEIALTNVRIAASKAQKALNAAMLTNPYVALATVVAGLAATMWALKDNTTAAEKAQNRFNDIKDKVTQKEQEHKTAIQSLIETVRDDTKSITERQAAMIALRNEYPSIFSQYDTESLKLANLIDLNKRLNEEMALRAKSEAMNRITSQEDVIKQMKQLGVSNNRINEEKEVLKKLQKDYLMQYSLPDYTASLKDLDIEELYKELGGAKFMASGSGTGTYNGMQADSEFYNSMVAAIESEIRNRKATPTFAVDYENAKKEWETAKKELEKIEKDKDAYTTKQYEAAKARAESAEKAFKNLGGDVKGKEDKAESKDVSDYNASLARSEKSKQTTERNASERARTAKDMEFMMTQAQIDAMKEGAEKMRRQRELDNAKEIEDLQRRKEDYISKVVEMQRAEFDAAEEEKAKNNKKYKKQTFDSEAARANVDTTAYDKTIAETKKKQENQEDVVVESLLDKYKSYQEQKAELEKSFLQDSLTLNNAYLATGDEKYMRSLDERYKAYVQALAKLDQSSNKADYNLIFGDPKKMTNATIDKALNLAREKMSQIDKDADPETFKALSEAIQKLEDARDNNPFEGWGTSLMGLIQNFHQIRNLKKDIAKYEEEGNKEAKEASEAQLEKSKKTLSKALIGTGVSQFGETLTTAAASMREIAQASGDIDLERQAKALENAGSAVSSIAQGAASGGWVGAIIGGVSSLVNMVTSSLTESAVAAAEAKSAYQEYLDIVAQSARTIDSADYESIFGTKYLEEARAAYDAAQKSLEDYYTAYNQHGTRYNYNNKGWIMPNDLKEQLVWAGTKQTAKNAYKVPTVGEMFPEIFDKDGNLILDKAKDVLDGYSQYAAEEWYEYLNDAVAALEDYEDNIAKVDDYLTSLFSDLGSDLAEAIMQGNDALDVLNQNAGNIFASIAKQMIAEFLITGEFLEKYKDKWRAAIATSDASDDADVIKEMVDELAGRIDEATSFYESLKAEADKRGIDMNATETSSQSASAKGYQALSEDTGSELSGRALALYESNLRIESAATAQTMALTDIKGEIAVIYEGQNAIRDIASNTRQIIADSYLELQQIRENTDNISSMQKKINEKLTKWDSKIMSM